MKTVGELVAELQKRDQNATVSIELADGDYTNYYDIEIVDYVPGYVSLIKGSRW